MQNSFLIEVRITGDSTEATMDVRSEILGGIYNRQTQGLEGGKGLKYRKSKQSYLRERQSSQGGSGQGGSG
jgi:hypothetical protein